ncbi:hypothetical protein FALBO_14867 [Fusarium albosuccineum]|uniref:Uncharacterized protein n=1 Tax=Fusarium albosuccineum TaxID=1237068 RepID=A0A8H4P6Y6_9HYPO|nr:hypothetical protein FALBO_14867 [Fusarium albosuccineum]
MAPRLADANYEAPDAMIIQYSTLSVLHERYHHIFAISVPENPKNTTLPDRQPTTTVLPETAACPPRHSVASQRKNANICDNATLVGREGKKVCIRTVLSPEADATIVESCENTTDLTQSLWPSSTCSHFPVFAFQIRTVSSSEADATIVESCENTTDLTPLLWPSSTCSHFPVFAFQIRTVLS